jgi:hypothetical protein
MCALAIAGHDGQLCAVDRDPVVPRALVLHVAYTVPQAVEAVAPDFVTVLIGSNDRGHLDDDGHATSRGLTDRAWSRLLPWRRALSHAVYDR